jgi:hypothetical protein
MRQRRHTSGHIAELLCDLGTDRCALQMFTPGLQEPRIIMISLWAPPNVRTLSAMWQQASRSMSCIDITTSP